MNNTQRFRLWLYLSVLGLIAVFSLTLSTLPTDNLPPEVLERISPETLKWLILINPAIIILVMTGIGVLTFEKAGYRSPIFEKLVDATRTSTISVQSIIINGIIAGVVAGLLIVGIGKVMEPLLPEELVSVSKGPDLHIVTRLLYGGIAEELMIRFGMMSLLTWLLLKTKRITEPVTHYFAILISSLLFALGHLPIVFQVVENPDAFVYLYIILGNSIGGLVFGWIFWKRGLESAIIAHAVTHLTMVSLSTF